MKPPKLLADRRGRLFAALVGLSLLQAIGFAGTALATRAAFSALSQDESMSTLILGILAGSAALAVLAQFGFRIFAEAIGQDYAKSVRLKLFEHASASAQSDLDKRRRGYQFMRFIGDLTALKQWPGIGLPRLIQALVVLPVSTAVLFHLSSSFGWLALGVVTVAVITLAAGHSPLIDAHQAQRTQRAKLAADMAERIPLAPQLNAAQRQDREAEKLSRQTDRLAKLAIRQRRVAETLKMAPDLAAGCAAAAILALGARQGLSTGSIAGALAALALTAAPLRNFMATANKAAAFNVAHGRLAALLERPTVDAERATQKLVKGPLTLELCLPNFVPICVGKGQKYALSADILDQITPYFLGTEPPPKGWIKLGGEDAVDLDPASLGRRVALIDERPLALKGSLRRALGLGLQQRPTDQQILKRVKKVGLGETLEALGGLDRRLAEGAADLTSVERTQLSTLQAAVLRPGLLLVRHGIADPAVATALNQLSATQITKTAA